jgi:hypothetical protein
MERLNGVSLTDTIRGGGATEDYVRNAHVREFELCPTATDATTKLVHWDHFWFFHSPCTI